MKEPLTRARSTLGRDAVLGLAGVILINVIFYYWHSIWHFIMTKSPWLDPDKWPWIVETTFAVFGSILALCFLGLIVRVVGLLLWLFMNYLVEQYREGGGGRERWREHNKDWRASYGKMRPFPKFFFDTLGWVLWGAVGLGILWSIRACSKAIIEPDDHPPAYYDTNP